MNLKDLFRRGSHERNLEKLLRLLEVNKVLSGETGLGRLLDAIVDAAIELMAAERGFVIVEDGTNLRVESARNADREDLRRPLSKISTSIVKLVLGHREGLRVDDAGATDELAAAGSVVDLKLRSVLAAPLIGPGGVLGCLYVDNRFARGSFSDDDRFILEAFADQAAIALTNAELREEARLAQQRLQLHNEDLRRELCSRDEELSRMRAQLEPPPTRAELAHPYAEIIGRSEAIRRVLHLLDRVLDGDYPVLISGESGTGKELIARALHQHGQRAEGPFIGLNCAAIPSELVESELFGYARGAFTGAEEDHAGSFEQAGGGILFLDEVGELPLPVQAKLLRVLQEGVCRPVGGREERRCDVRVVAATNQNLEERIAAGLFRADLYYRIRVVEIALPALRERIEDVEELAERFLRQAGSGAPRLTAEALEVLRRYAWPGNVRELENEITRLAAMLGEREIRASDLSLSGKLDRSIDVAAPLRGLTLEQIEEQVIRHTLERVAGRRSEAARLLGIPRRTLYNRMKKYGLS